MLIMLSLSLSLSLCSSIHLFPLLVVGSPGDVAEFLETEGDLGARHVQEVLAQLVSGGVSGVPVVAAPRPELIPNFLAREPENADVTRALAASAWLRPRVEVVATRGCRV